jgi:hypothetical protein
MPTMVAVGTLRFAHPTFPKTQKAGVAAGFLVNIQFAQ